MSVPFRERNPVVVGAASLVVIAILMVTAFKAGDLPLIGGGDTYYASFTEAGGIKPNDEVRVAGVRVGKVKAVDLVDGQVRVKFQVQNGTDFGDRTGAAIKVKTILGSMFLALQPDGTGQLKAGSVIPASRTSSPFDVVDVFSGLAERGQRIDTEQLSTALDTMASLTKNTPEEFRAALKGVSALSANVAARDEQLNTLLGNLQKVSAVLADRKDDVVALTKDGDQLFRALAARRQAVHSLLVATSNLSVQLTGLVRDTRADLKPALDNLQSVVDLLNANQENLDRSLRLMAPFYRVFANTLGSGPWFDTILNNVPPLPQVGGQ